MAVKTKWICDRCGKEIPFGNTPNTIWVKETIMHARVKKHRVKDYGIDLCSTCFDEIMKVIEEDVNDKSGEN